MFNFPSANITNFSVLFKFKFFPANVAVTVSFIKDFLLSFDIETHYTSFYFFFLFGRCVKAEAAAVFANFGVLLLRSVLLEADPAFTPVTLFVLRCVRADPAADFAALVALGLLSVLAAAVAAFLLVFSFLFVIFHILTIW